MSRKCRVSTKTTKLFADRLSDLVDEKKGEMYSQKQIASSIGVSSGSLFEWCSDQVTATIDNLVQIARYFGVSADYLLGLTDVKSQKPDIKSINQATGLHETAIKCLMMAKTFSKSTVAGSTFTGQDALMFYSHLISDVRVLETVAFVVDRLVSIQNEGLKESEKDVFKDSDEATSFYQYKIQKTLDNFVKSWLELYKEKNGSTDKEGSGEGRGG